MLHIHREKTNQLKKIITLFSLSLLCVTTSFSQRVLHMEEHDAKPLYFGISLGLNRASFHADLHSSFLQQDSIFTGEPLNTSGFNLGLSATARLSPRFSLRFNPQLIFLERVLEYSLQYADFDNAFIVQKKVESVITSFPLHVKFQSDRIGNFRVYMFGGGKMDMDLASNAQARKAEDMIKIGRFDYGIEAGVGFSFYNKSFILSPEIRISNGLNNLHSRQEQLNYSRVMDNIKSRMIMFTIHLEG